MRTADENKRAEVAYEMAYFLLPRRVHSELEELKSEFDESPELGAVSYFIRSAKFRGITLNTGDAQALRVHSGRLDSERIYIVIEYPRYTVVDLLANASLGWDLGSHVLAPYFSAIIEDRGSREAEYFVLGQSPDAKTTLRMVSPTTNANLGPGCEPALEAFLKLLRKRYAKAQAEHA